MKPIINFSLAANLGLHALKFLLDADAKAITLKELAKRLDCSANHLSKVLQKLVQAGILSSGRGPKGGFTLLNFEASFWQILQILDGEFSEHCCLLNRRNCLFGSCVFGDKLNIVTTELRNILKSKRIKDLKD